MIAIMIAVLTLTLVALQMIVECQKRELKSSFFCAELPLDKCGLVWYNRGGEKFGPERSDWPEFPIFDPICEIFE